MKLQRSNGGNTNWRLRIDVGTGVWRSTGVSERPSSRTRRANRGGRPTAGSELTVEAVASATLEVIADGGVESLTRGRVAEALGVSVRGLYRLAPSVDHLVAAAAVEWQRRWPLPPLTADWVADLRTWCTDTRAHAAAYPGLTAAVQRIPPALVGDATGPIVQAVLARLVEVGFAMDEAQSLFGVLSMHCLGWAVIFPDGLVLDASAVDMDAEMAQAHASFRSDGFTLGLDLLLEGIAARLGAKDEV